MEDDSTPSQIELVDYNENLKELADNEISDEIDVESASLLNSTQNTCCSSCLSCVYGFFITYRIFEIIFIWGMYEYLYEVGISTSPSLNHQYIPTVRYAIIFNT